MQVSSTYGFPGVMGAGRWPGEEAAAGGPTFLAQTEGP